MHMRMIEYDAQAMKYILQHVKNSVWAKEKRVQLLCWNWLPLFSNMKLNYDYSNTWKVYKLR